MIAHGRSAVPAVAIAPALALVTLLTLLAGGLAAEARADGIELHAHRGAPLEEGVPVAPENSLSAAYRAAERWHPDYVEIDVKYTSDGVPVNFHDATLDRTTTCSGRIVDITLEELRRCRLDVDGTSGSLRPIARPSERVPTLGQMLTFTERTGTKLNVEIKNLPTESDYNPSPAVFVDPIIDLIHARGMLDREHVMFQSFWPLDLDRAAARINSLVPDPERRPLIHLLTLQPLSEGAIVFSAAAGYEGVGPQWSPLTGPVYFGLAAAAGLRVVPWTINDPEQMRAALNAGADGLITDDLALANEVAGRPGPSLTARVRGRSPQRGPGRVQVRTLCQGSGCTLTLRPRLRLRQPGGRTRVFNLARQRFHLDRGQARQVAVRPRPPVRRAARNTLRRGGQAQVIVVGRARDTYRTLSDGARTRIALRR